MKILLITKFLPLPANDGGKLRSLAVARALADQGRLVMCGFDAGEADIQGLRDLGIEVCSAPLPGAVAVVPGAARTGSLAAGRFWSPALSAKVTEAAIRHEHFDVAIVEYAHLWNYLRNVRADRTILASHNVESALVKSYAKTRGPFLGMPYRLEASALRRVERRAVNQADIVSVVSETDKKRLPGRPRRVLVCPNGWSSRGIMTPAEKPVAAFVALLGWAPNVDAALWVASEVWPLVRRQVPGAQLLLVGRDPAPAIRRLAAPDLVVTGTVEDVRPYLARARVALAPLRAGSGSRLKVLEALDAGRPVVGTTKGLEGLESLIGQGAIVADKAPAMAEVVARLLTDPRRAEQLGRRGHDAVVARYSWGRVLSPLLEAVCDPVKY